MSEGHEEVPLAYQRQSFLAGAAATTGGAAGLEQNMPADVLLKAAARQGHRIPNEPEQQQKLLRQLTHLHLNGLQLQQLQSLRLCPRLQVLYLYDNELTSIASICSNRLLTHLYVQHNRLQQLEGLQDLGLLQKLYLQGNCLASIDHLSACSRLEELHVSDQQWQQQEGSRGPRPLAVEQQQHEHLQQLESSQQAASQHSNVGSSSSSSSTTGQVPDMQLGRTAHLQSASSLTAAGLQFELASLQAISGSLRVLCAANCGIQDPGPLAVLQKLHTLDLSGNSIQQLALLLPVLQRLQRLRVLDVRGNPCSQHELKYRDYVILLAADNLETLDNETVPASHRAFLLGLHLKKLKAQERSEEQQQQQQLTRKQQGQQLFLHQGISGKPAAGACAAAPSGGLSGTGVTLYSMKAPAVRPTAAGGFNASDARIAAALGGTRGRNGVDAAASAEHI